MLSIRRFNHGIIFLLTAAGIAFSRPVFETAESTSPLTENTPVQITSRIIEIEPSHLIIEIDFPAVRWNGGDSIPEICGAEYIVRPGEPRLPKSVHIFQVPPGDFSFRIIDYDTAMFKTRRLPPFIDAQNEGRINEKPAIYKRSAFYPDRTVELERLGSYHGRQLARLIISPIRYNPVLEQIVVCKRLKIRVDFKNIEGVPGKTLSRSSQRVLTALLHEFPQTAAYPSNPQNPPAMPDNLGTSSGIKLSVSSEGLFRITYQALADSGINPADLGNPRNFKLTNRGESVPIYVHGEADGVFNTGDYIDFWGEPNRKTYIGVSPDMYKDPWTDENIYWLTWGGSPGAHMPEESAEIMELDPSKYYRPYNFRSILHVEEDKNFDRLSQLPRDTLRDHWYFDTGVDANETKLYNFFLPYPETSVATELAQVKAPLMGYTYPVSGGNPGVHYAIVSVNNYSTPAMEAGAPVGGGWPWIGQELWMIDTEGDEGIPNNYLHHGINNVRIYCSGNTPSGNNNTIMLNWFEISYTQKYIAVQGFLKFTAPENGPADTLYNFVIDDFPVSDIQLYKIGSSKMTNFEMTENPLTGLYKLRFQDRLYGGEEFVALIPDSIKSPDRIELDEPSDLKNPLNQAEYLIISHPDFLENELLLEHLDRRSGYGSMMIDVNDIYDEFNDGIVSPQAVKDFLTYAYNYWADPKPFYVLLAGDGSWDQKDYFGKGGNLIPSYYLQTQAYGYSATDYWMVLLEGDDFIPEMSIGRIPARENEEIDVYLTKVIQNEQSPVTGYWHDRYLFISGSGVISGTTFQQRAQQAIDLLPHWMFVERLETDDAASPYFGGNSELTEFFDTGVSIISYNGHGGGGIWDDNNIMDVSRVANLNNTGRYPFIANFTCYICQYDVRDPRTTLGEEFIFSEEKGALGVYGATGLGWFEEGSTLQRAMSNALSADQNLTMGELVTYSKINFLSLQFGSVTPSGIGTEAYDTMMNMILLGDPAAQILMPENNDEIVLEPMISGSSPLDLEIDLPVESGEFVVRVYDDQSYPVFSGGAIWQSIEYPFTDNHLSITVDPGQVAFPKEGSFRISYYSYDNSGDGGVFADFVNSDSMAVTDFDSYGTIPSPLYDDDSLRFHVRVLDQDGISQLRMKYQIYFDLQDTVVFADTVDLYPLDQYAIEWESELIEPLSDTLYNVLKITVLSEDSVGNSAVSEFKNMTIFDHRPDLLVDTSSIFLSGDKIVSLAAYIQNTSDSHADSVLVHFYAERSGENEQMVGADWAYDIELLDSALVQINPDPQLIDGSYNFRLVVDPYHYIDEKDSSNNTAETQLVIDRFGVTPAAGTNIGGVNSEYSFENFTFNISPGAVEDSSLLFAESIDSCSISQDGLDFYDNNDCGYFHLSNLPGGLSIPDGFRLTWQFPVFDSISTEGLAVHYRELTGAAWNILPTAVVSDTNGIMTVETEAGSLGLFGLLINSDSQPPAIEITVDGQTFTDGGYVPASPRINAIFSDAGGVDENSLWVMIDDDTLAAELLSPPVMSENSNTVSISIDEDLSAGIHTLKMGGRDLSGNTAVNSFTVKVSGGFNFKFIGNYPNPFKDKTYIAYSLTDQPDGDIVVKIYTVSGRKIRTLRQPAKINYDEILWDGRDETGNSLANGVYFCKVKVRKGGKKIEKIMKTAKVR